MLAKLMMVGSAVYTLDVMALDNRDEEVHV